MNNQPTRRDVIKTIGYSTAMLPFMMPSVARAKSAAGESSIQRLIIMFTPNGTVQDEFWPDTQGTEYELKKILEPLAPFKQSMLVTHGIHNKIRGDGDNHMRGMGCLLTGIELFPGNIQGGSHTPAGWAKGISIDQEIRNFLQAQDATRTRFGSLEFGVAVANRADPWTRMCYAGANKPIAPITNPYSMFEKMYGQGKNDKLVKSVLDDIAGELKKFSGTLDSNEKAMLDEHVTYVRKLEQDLESAAAQMLDVVAPDLPMGASVSDSNMPQITKMQMDLLVNGFANDMNRIATLQFSNSVGSTRMKWLGFPEGHHQMSHDPDLKVESQEKLTKINIWYAQQLLYLVKQLSETKEPGTDRSLLDGTLIVWGNELGKGNSHTLNNIPFLMIGNAPGFKVGRYHDFEGVPHNRLLMSLAHAFGHKVETFGNADLCVDGPLTELGG